MDIALHLCGYQNIGCSPSLIFGALLQFGCAGRVQEDLIAASYCKIRGTPAPSKLQGTHTRPQLPHRGHPGRCATLGPANWLHYISNVMYRSYRGVSGAQLPGKAHQEQSHLPGLGQPDCSHRCPCANRSTKRTQRCSACSTPPHYTHQHEAPVRAQDYYH